MATDDADEPLPATYPGWAAALAANPDDDTLRLGFADWLDERGDHDEAVAQRSAAKAVRTRRVGSWAVGPGVWHALRDEVTQTDVRRWIAPTVVTTVHFVRGVPGGELDIWVDDRIVEARPGRVETLLDRGGVPLDYPPPTREDPDLRLSLEVWDKIGTYSGRRWSLTLRLLAAHQWRHLSEGRVSVGRADGWFDLAVRAGRRVVWSAALADRTRTITTRAEAERVLLWHWQHYYRFLPRDAAEPLAAVFGAAAVLPADINELNRAASRELYAAARAEGWRKLTAREQRRHGLLGQWHPVRAVEAAVAARADNHNPSGAGDATIRAAAGRPETGFGPDELVRVG